MVMADANTIYSGSDNPLVLGFTLNGAIQDLTTATKFIVEITGSSLIFNSVDDSSMFDLTQITQGIVSVNLSAITLADGVYNLRITVIDPVHPDGIVWAHEDDAYPTKLTFVNLT